VNVAYFENASRIASVNDTAGCLQLGGQHSSARFCAGGRNPLSARHLVAAPARAPRESQLQTRHVNPRMAGLSSAARLATDRAN